MNNLSNISPTLIQQIQLDIQNVTNQTITLCDITPIFGGDINQSFKITTNKENYFLKLNKNSSSLLFEAEKAGLKAISSTKTLLVPSPIYSGKQEQNCYLILSFIDINPHGDEYTLGQHLALMHKHTHHQYGFSIDNFIGLTPQENHWQDIWAEFWLTQRLQPQTELALQNGYHKIRQPMMKLLKNVPDFLNSYQPEPSLVHGDLWSGNKGYLADGTPVIFDPACYYGDRETDIAMTHLFGGFSNRFYQGYEDTWPLTPGHEQRRKLYNLYHLINHLNLFGDSYLSTVINTIEQINNS